MLFSRLNLLKKLEWRHCEGGKRNVRGRNLKARAISSLLPGGQILCHRTKKWKYICGLFANCVVDTGSKFATELSKTLARLVEKFAAGVVDTGGVP
jgi:hypothetical protein